VIGRLAVGLPTLKLSPMIAFGSAHPMDAPRLKSPSLIIPNMEHLISAAIFLGFAARKP
jgi:hypothetical protein